ncbi:MAG TPA: hypothetical protein VFG79_08760, partial [Solirubrobacter sp.]|nr:hypothetical protein [Solirubrobacter sp.]
PLLSLQAGAGNAAVCRMLATAKLARAVAEDLDYETLAQRIHDAMAGWGTDEEGVYEALQQLNRDPTAIAKLKATYKTKFAEELEDAIRDEFSAEELEYALQLIGGGTPGSAQAVGASPAAAGDFEAAATRIRSAVEGWGTDEEAIYAVLRPLNRDQALIDKVLEAYKTKFGEDLVARIEDEMSGSELQYALHLLRRGPSAGMEKVTAEMESHVGEQATWQGSGPGSGDTFETWASAPTEAAAPPISSLTTINCWEMILLCAYRAGLLSWQWIHDQYTSSAPNWRIHMYDALSRGARTPWKPGDAPVRGELVFFDDIAHVALATGGLDGAGKAPILSFWPPPDHISYTWGTLDAVKLTTIDDLADFWKTNKPPGFAKIELAAPPWS